MAAEPGLAAALRLPPVIFDRALQDVEARAGRSQVCMGQTGAHRRCELRACGEPRPRQRPVADDGIVIGTAVPKTLPDSSATPSTYASPASRYRRAARLSSSAIRAGFGSV